MSRNGCSRILVSLLLVVGTVSPIAQSAEENFQFAGLSLGTTIQEARTRYPRSEFSGRHVYVSDAESHDDVHAIDLPDTTPNRRLRLFFERTTAKGNSYPACDKVLATLRARYGAPATVQEFDEERSRNRRLIWRKVTEEMSLLCFRQQGQAFSAAELTIGNRVNN